MSFLYFVHIIKEMTQEDADAFGEITGNDRIYFDLTDLYNFRMNFCISMVLFPYYA